MKGSSISTSFTVLDTNGEANMTSKRISVSLPEETARLLELIAKSQGISQNEAIRRAIATEAYLRQATTEGYKVLLQSQEKEIREVVFR